ncbi:MAG: chemotaxis protein CheW [Pseudomonadota bacterium]
MSSENAWLLDFGKPLRAAVGMRELLQIIDASEIYEVPLTPAHSRHIMFWQKRMIPVMDLSLRLGAKATQSKMLALVGYQDHANQSVGIGAIVLAAPPLKIAVDDADAAVLDEQTSGWRELAISGFAREGAVIPVLHLSRVFGQASYA